MIEYIVEQLLVHVLGFIIINLSILINIYLEDKGHKFEFLAFVIFVISAFGSAMLIANPLVSFLKKDTASELIKFILIVVNVVMFFTPMFKSVDSLDKWLEKINLDKNAILIRRQLSKNYSAEYRAMLIRLAIYLRNENIVEFSKNLHLTQFKTESLSSNYRIIEEKFQTFKEVVKFFNENMEWANNKEQTNVVESAMLDSENINKLVFVLNILEDKEKVKFISSNEGSRYRYLIQEDFDTLLYFLKTEVKKVSSLEKNTKDNSIACEIERLRRNTFNTIEDITK